MFNECIVFIQTWFLIYDFCKKNHELGEIKEVKKTDLYHENSRVIEPSINIWQK